MIYPKGIVDFVKNDPALSQMFPLVCADHPLHTLGASRHTAISPDFDAWMLHEGQAQSLEIKKYLFFLALMSAAFENIRLAFDRNNPGRENEKDGSAIATSPQEMFFIARYLYYLDSHGVQGNVLECGCFKGFSSCCLSWVCSYLGRKLIIADSFEGLPDVGHSYYNVRDFKGEFATVQNNLYVLGRPDCVEFLKGWYSESLIGFNRPICVLWMDVDLYQSAMDVLINVYPSLNKDGVIFSHEFNIDCVKEALISTPAPSDVASAIRDYFTAKKIPYQAKFLTGYLALLVPNVPPGNLRLSPGTTLRLRGFGFPGRTFFPPEPTSLSPRDGVTQFSIDQINEKRIDWTDPQGAKISGNQPVAKGQSELSVSGWAIDQPAGDLSGGVLICIDGRLYPAYYGLDRDDVAQALKFPKYRYSGFEASIPISELQEGEHKLSIRVVTSDQSSYYSPSNTVTFTIR
jgi:hypothetical protein